MKNLLIDMVFTMVTIALTLVLSVCGLITMLSHPFIGYGLMFIGGALMMLLVHAHERYDWYVKINKNNDCNLITVLFKD